MNTKNQRRQIFGEEIKRKVLTNFALVECLYPARATMVRHTHEIAHLSLVLQGSFTEICGRKARSSSPSTLIIHPPDEDHTVTFHDAGARVFSFHISNRMLDRIRDVTNILESPATFSDGQSLWLTARLYRELQTTDSIAQLMIEGLSFEIIAAVSRRAESLRERHISKRVKQAQEYLHAHYTENISFTSLAETVGTHPVRLAREFRCAFGTSMGEYTRRLRIEKACQKISRSYLPLSQIACSVGFYDQSHFTNIFKRITGMTPAQYRAIFRYR
jgi:AraC family transcriptional regulator